MWFLWKLSSGSWINVRFCLNSRICGLFQHRETGFALFKFQFAYVIFFYFVTVFIIRSLALFHYLNKKKIKVVWLDVNVLKFLASLKLLYLVRHSLDKLSLFSYKFSLLIPRCDHFLCTGLMKVERILLVFCVVWVGARLVRFHCFQRMTWSWHLMCILE